MIAANARSATLHKAPIFAQGLADASEYARRSAPLDGVADGRH